METDMKNEKIMLLLRSLLTGLIGGMLLGFFGALLYYFNFTEVAPKTYVLESWLTAEWVDSWKGDLFSVFAVGLLSILIAFVYYGLGKRMRTIWSGIGFGVLLWLLLFVLFQPLFTNIQKVGELSLDTIITTGTLFIIYGMFVGYSISYDYHDTQILHKNKTK
ncbi:MAG TPA: YqhR family membrane protein [Virgibacillus sp.]|nr:YqhR family membrane protein [Virgibacillus sp.]